MFILTVNRAWLHINAEWRKWYSNSYSEGLFLQQRLNEVNRPDHTLISYPNLWHAFYPWPRWKNYSCTNRALCFSIPLCMAFQPYKQMIIWELIIIIYLTHSSQKVLFCSKLWTHGLRLYQMISLELGSLYCLMILWSVLFSHTKYKNILACQALIHSLFIVFIRITDSIAYSCDSISVNNGVKPFLYSTTICLPNLLGIPANLIVLSNSIICLHRLCISIVIFRSHLLFLQMN